MQHLQRPATRDAADIQVIGSLRCGTWPQAASARALARRARPRGGIDLKRTAAKSMSNLRLLARAGVAATCMVSCIGAAAQDAKPVRIGVLNGQSSVYSDFHGCGSVLAARMAVEDYSGRAAGRPVEVLSADHQNKPDVGASIARRWMDVDDVQMIADLPNSAIALGVADIVKEKNKVMMGSGAGSVELTGARCSPNTVHWTDDTWSYGHSLARAVLQRGGKSWFFITADYAFGHDLEKQASEEVTKGSGKVMGAARTLIGTAGQK